MSSSNESPEIPVVKKRPKRRVRKANKQKKWCGFYHLAQVLQIYILNYLKTKLYKDEVLWKSENYHHEEQSETSSSFKFLLKLNMFMHKMLRKSC